MLDDIKHGSFKLDYKATDEEAMGLLLSHFFEYDGIAILEAADHGLTHSNFADAKDELDELVKREQARTEAAIKAQQKGTVALVGRGWPETGLVTARCMTSVLAGFRFPQEVISLAVRWYLRYGLSYRDVEELAERGITVDHVTIYRWVQRFTPEFTGAARPCRHAPADQWFAGETYVKAAGTWTYLYRAAGQYGQVIDILCSTRRDLAAARRLFMRALRAGTVPAEVTTNRAPSYPGFPAN